MGVHLPYGIESSSSLDSNRSAIVIDLCAIGSQCPAQEGVTCAAEDVCRKSGGCIVINLLCGSSTAAVVLVEGNGYLAVDREGGSGHIFRAIAVRASPMGGNGGCTGTYRCDYTRSVNRQYRSVA